jgi:hypothetical protein
MRGRIAPATLTLVCVAAGPLTAQGNPLARFEGTYEVLSSTLPAPNAEIIYRRVSDGLGLHSVWRHGEGASFYEAHALWGYDRSSSLVTVLEVNSLGVVAIHRGGFDDAGVLTLERIDDDGARVLERRRFWWSNEATLEMTLDILSMSPPVRHEVALARHE